MRSCNGFIPGQFRLTGPKADHGPALTYAETALRRAEEAGIKTVVFGSGGARNVPGDMTLKGEERPDTERGRAQYTEFCRLLCDRVKDLRTVEIVIEPLRPRESNIINYVWEGAQICREVDSPRLKCLADIFHMMMGHDEPDSLLKAGASLIVADTAAAQPFVRPGTRAETTLTIEETGTLVLDKTDKPVKVRNFTYAGVPMERGIYTKANCAGIDGEGALSVLGHPGLTLIVR